MADIQALGVGLENSLSPNTNVDLEDGDVQSKEPIEWLEVFERPTVGMGGGGLGHGFDGDMTVPLPNSHIAESDGPSFANNFQELSIYPYAFDDALFVDKTISCQDMMGAFEFPEFFNALAFETRTTASEVPR
jgi:hypothetical protein